MVPVTGIDLHFCLGAKIKVATSVCTGGSRCPLDICIWMGSIPFFLHTKKSTPVGVGMVTGIDLHFLPLGEN